MHGFRLGVFLLLVPAIWLLVPYPALTGGDSTIVRHEDPDSATVYYDGVAILNYYAGIIDGILAQSPATVKSLQSKKPFTNTPKELNASLKKFTNASAAMAELVVSIQADVKKGEQCISQYQLESLDSIRDRVSSNIDQSYAELWRIDHALAVAADSLAVPSNTGQDPLGTAYSTVVKKRDQLDALLNFFNELLQSMAVPDLESQLAPTRITLMAEPRTQYVGKAVSIQGKLTSSGVPLADRPIVILFDGIPRAQMQTGPEGGYAASLQLPYQYTRNAELQAVYYPRETDTGKYQGSRSEAVTLELLFYAGVLTLTQQTDAFPGRELAIAGEFDYPPDNVSPVSRELAVYLDGELVDRRAAGEAFVVHIHLPADTPTGSHQLLISAPAEERYAPVSAEVTFEVGYAIPVIDIDPPSLAVMPLKLELNGKAYTGLGPLENTPIEVTFGSHKARVVTAEDGTFSLSLNTGLNFSIVGSEKLQITALPEHAWASSSNRSFKLIVLNSVSTGVLGIVLIAVLGFAVRRYRILSADRKARQRMRPAQNTPAQPGWNAFKKQRKRKLRHKTLGELIVETYTILIKRLQSVTGIKLSPGMTLREFSTGCGQTLGPGRAYLDRFTRIIEQILYSPRPPSFTDWDESQSLNLGVETSVNYENA